MTVGTGLTKDATAEVFKPLEAKWISDTDYLYIIYRKWYNLHEWMKLQKVI